LRSSQKPRPVPGFLALWRNFVVVIALAGVRMLHNLVFEAHFLEIL
jgi:hypothetical protein